jgi:hypothetical protein
VEIAGIPLQSAIFADNVNVCAMMCSQNPTCTTFTYSVNRYCNLNYMPFESLYGSTGISNVAYASCLVKTPKSSASLPSPENTVCFSGQFVAGQVIAATTAITDHQACILQCKQIAGCTYSIFWASGKDSISPPFCEFRFSAFKPYSGGESPSDTRRDPLVSGICFRVEPAPAVIGECITGASHAVSSAGSPPQLPHPR